MVNNPKTRNVQIKVKKIKNKKERQTNKQTQEEVVIKGTLPINQTHESCHLMDELVVEANKPLMRKDLGKRVCNVRLIKTADT